MELLLDLLNIKSVSGDESQMRQFLLNHVRQEMNDWKVLPMIYHGENLHDCLLLKFGNPRTVVFAHVDTIGFMARYQNQLVCIGGPETETDTLLEGEDSLGPILCKLKNINGELIHDFPRAIDRGTCLSFVQNVRIDDEYIQAAYLDNRLGIYNALQLCKELEDGWVVFSTYEEHGGGSMPYLLKFIMEESPISQALISDITWVTEGVEHGKGVAISIRDKYIPRRNFLDRIIDLAKKSEVSFQIEVEDMGGSDGREIQFSPYAIDWCFIGAPEDYVHSTNEKVALYDLQCMTDLYKFLMTHL